MDVNDLVGLEFIGAALLVEVGVVSIDEARELIGLQPLTPIRRADLKAASKWISERGMRLPGFALSLWEAKRTEGQKLEIRPDYDEGKD